MRIERTDDPEEYELYIVSEYSPDLTLNLRQMVELHTGLQAFISTEMLRRLPNSAEGK